MTEWKAMADGLARALRSRPCNCEQKYLDGKPEPVTTKRCSRCLELERYDDMVQVSP